MVQRKFFNKIIQNLRSQLASDKLASLNEMLAMGNLKVKLIEWYIWKNDHKYSKFFQIPLEISIGKFIKTIEKYFKRKEKQPCLASANIPEKPCRKWEDYRR